MAQIELDFTVHRAPQRSYKKYVTSEQTAALHKAGVMKGGCVPLALSRALAKPDDVADSVRRIAHVVKVISRVTWKDGTTLRFDRKRGAWTGSTMAALDALGVTYRRAKPEPEWKARFRPYCKNAARVGRYDDDDWLKTETPVYPTVAQWLRDNPNVRRAVIRTNAHAAFIDNGIVYGATARYRVKDAYIIEEVT